MNVSQPFPWAWESLESLGRRVARALLWRDLPYPLLTYAVRNPVFPHDSTSDQWFDDGQFDAYTELGRKLAARVSGLEPGPERPLGPEAWGEVEVAG